MRYLILTSLFLVGFLHPNTFRHKFKVGECISEKDATEKTDFLLITKVAQGYKTTFFWKKRTGSVEVIDKNYEVPFKKEALYEVVDMNLCSVK
jgi:hypothetical protein